MTILQMLFITSTLVFFIKRNKMIKNLIFISILLFSGNFLFAQSKIALVIGNSSYQQMPLQNPGNDAYDLSTTLRTLGFDVLQKTNLNRQEMEEAIRSFKQKIKPGDVALFYFSGHGTQVNGLNYLIPVNEQVNNEIDIKYHCVEAGFVLDNMEQARAGVNIIILDACRNNPYKGERSASRGFAFMSAPTGSIIAYSTSPGSVAMDGDGRNSPFTKNLIEKMQLPGLKIEEVFKEVRKEVASETGRRQIPWESSSLMGDFYFKKGTTSTASPYNNPGTTTYKPPIETSVTPHEIFSGSSGTFTDTRDGQTYKWVRIGTQIWMAENLNYQTSNSCCYDDYLINCDRYGRLYNWDAAMVACPKAWRLPSIDDWKILISELGGKSIAGGKMKEQGFTNWNEPNIGADNSSGFRALPGGYKDGIGNFLQLRNYGNWASSDENDLSQAWYIHLNISYPNVFINSYSKYDSFSVRCLKN